MLQTNLRFSFFVLLLSIVSFHAQAASVESNEIKLSCSWRIGTTGMSAIWLGAGSHFDLYLKNKNIPIQGESIEIKTYGTFDFESPDYIAYDYWDSLSGKKVKPMRGWAQYGDFSGMEFLVEGHVIERKPGQPGPYLKDHKQIKAIVDLEILKGSTGWVTLATLATDTEAPMYLPDYVSYFCNREP